MSHKVFLSYTRTDQPIVQVLRDDLVKMGNTVFFDQQLTGGQSWWSTLLDQIRICDVFVPVVGAGWLESIPCQRETDYAHSLGKEFIPLILDDTSAKLLPASIAETHWVKYDSGSKTSVLELMRALATVGPSPDLPQPLPEPPAVPISYLTELRERVQVDHDITRDQQALILSDVRQHVDRGEDQMEVRIILQAFRKRAELTAFSRDEIDEILVELEAADVSAMDVPTPPVSTQPPSPVQKQPPVQPLYQQPPPAPRVPPANQPPAFGYQPEPLVTHNDSKIVGAYVLSAIAVFFIPPLFGGIAIWLAASEKKVGNPKAQTAMTVAIGATVVGFILGAILLSGL